MDFIFEHLLDIITLIIVMAVTAAGYKKGIMRMIISLIGYFVAATVAGFISSITYEYVYFNMVQPSVIEYIENETEKISDEYLNERFSEDNSENDENIHLTDSEISGKLKDIFKEYCEELTNSLSGVIPDEILKSADEYFEKDTFDENEIINSTKTSSVNLIEKEIIRPVMLKTVKSVIFFIAFTIVCIIFSILSRLVRYIRRIDIIKAPDSFLGGILGFVYAVLIIVILSILCSIFIKLTADQNNFLNTEIIEKTYIFKYAYNKSFELLTILFK